MPSLMSVGSAAASMTTAGFYLGLRPKIRSKATIPPASIAPTVP
jgi:hypothetical protein